MFYELLTYWLAGFMSIGIYELANRKRRKEREALIYHLQTLLAAKGKQEEISAYTCYCCRQGFIGAPFMSDRTDRHFCSSDCWDTLTKL